jgi:hypothetical protein
MSFRAVLIALCPLELPVRATFLGQAGCYSVALDKFTRAAQIIPR